MITGYLPADLTADNVKTELDNLEADYRALKKKLKALYAVLKQEELITGDDE